MRWLKKSIAEWLGVYSIHDSDNDKVVTWTDEEPSSRSQSPNCDPVLNFKIYNAHGGKIVEFTSEQRTGSLKQQLGTTELYIITDAEDFGTAIMNIAVMQRLRTGV